MTDAPDQGKESAPKPKVFISYSRKDIDFADRLDAALKRRGFEPLIDRTDIYAFEEWWKRVEALIGRADTVVFMLSPDAVRPESIARKEVAFAASLNKRFAPIVFRPVDDKSKGRSPPRLEIGRNCGEADTLDSNRWTAGNAARDPEQTNECGGCCAAIAPVILGRPRLSGDDRWLSAPKSW